MYVALTSKLKHCTETGVTTHLIVKTVLQDHFYSKFESQNIFLNKKGRANIISVIFLNNCNY